MRFDSPIWLGLLIPWGGLVLWLLRGRLQTRGVPFLNLWQREAAVNPRPRRAWVFPPGAVVAMLVGLLLVVIGAAGPVVEISPERVQGPKPDVGIESLSVRSWPTTQAMVCLVNRSDLKSAKLTVRAGDVAVERDIELPGSGGLRNYFVDLPVASSKVDAEVVAGASGEIDHHLEAVRREAWPIVEARASLPAEVERMIEVYGRNRPASEGSKRVGVVMASEKVVGDEPVAIVVEGGESVHGEALTVRDSAVTESVGWDSVLAGARFRQPVGEGWKAMVSVGEKAVLAVREAPVREVWVGFDSERFGHRAEFVVFWSHVFEWLGQGEDSEQVAMAATEPAEPVVEAGKERSIAGEVVLGAMGMMVLSAMLWKKQEIRIGSG